MHVYQQLLQEQYDFLEKAYEQRISRIFPTEEKQTCPCGLVWEDECQGCQEGEAYKEEQVTTFL